MNRLVAYGCSWTEGEGADVSIESTLSANEKRKFRNEHSWPKLLADKLEIPLIINKGISGNSNRKMFNDIIKDVESGNITSSDFVCIMFSSSLRDYVPFLPDGEWISWSVKHLLQTPDRFYHSYDEHGVSRSFNQFLSNYKKYFVTNLFSQNYYNIVNQNYIIFLQQMFSHYKIKYIMSEGLELMVDGVNKLDDKTHLINYKNYFGNGNLTFRTFLNTLKRNDIWEKLENYQEIASQHPNKEGYRIISDELYKFINKNNIL